jgi:vacuolar-type H+-ATPase subunit I/STV1
MGNFDVFSVTDNSKEQLLDKVDDLEIQNKELLEQIEKLEGIRGALEEKVSAYRCRLKEVTKKLEDHPIFLSRDIVVYHNKDNLAKRQQASACGDSSRKTMEINDLQEKYEHLLEQYMFECDRSEQLFDYLFHQENDATLELFVKADAADTLLAAATTSRKIIQQAEEQAKYIESSLMERLNSVLKQKNNIPQEIIDDVKESLRCLEN